MDEYGLFLDDIRVPEDVTWISLPSNNYIIVRNYQEFVDTIIKHGVPAFVSFDHDLADEHYQSMIKDMQANSEIHLTFVLKQELADVYYGAEKTGYDCAKWLVNFCYDNDIVFPEYMIHSMNPVGAERIKRYIENAKIHLFDK